MENGKFETGASTAGANNLVLSVLSDGSVYADRLHCAWAELQGSSHRLSYKDIVNAEATKQRAQGSKFKPQEINEATKLIRADTLEHCLETLVSNYDNTRNICVSGRKWRDNVNGNTYFSCRVQIPQIGSPEYRIITIPFQYGYGEQWQAETISTLKNIGIVAKDTDNKYYREWPINWNFEGTMLKRDMYAGIYLSR